MNSQMDSGISLQGFLVQRGAVMISLIVLVVGKTFLLPACVGILLCLLSVVYFFVSEELGLASFPFLLNQVTHQIPPEDRHC